MSMLSSLEYFDQQELEKLIDEFEISGDKRESYWNNYDKLFNDYMEDGEIRCQLVADLEKDSITTPKYDLSEVKSKTYSIYRENSEERLVKEYERVYLKYLIAFLTAQDSIIFKDKNYGQEPKPEDTTQLYGPKEIFKLILTDDELKSPIIPLLDECSVQYGVIGSVLQIVIDDEEFADYIDKVVDFLSGILLTDKQKELRVFNAIEEESKTA